MIGKIILIALTLIALIWAFMDLVLWWYKE